MPVSFDDLLPPEPAPRRGGPVNFDDLMPPEKMSRLKAAGMWLGHGASFGTIDNIAAAVQTGSISGPAYDAKLAEARAKLDQAREQHPWTSGASDIAGAVAPALTGPVGLAARGASAVSRVLGRGAAVPGVSNKARVVGGVVEGATGGAAHAAGASNADTWDEMRDAAVVGGATGGFLGGAAAKIGNVVADRAVAKAIPSTTALRNMKNEAYEGWKNSGIVLNPQGAAQVERLIVAQLQKQWGKPGRGGPLKAILKDIDKLKDPKTGQLKNVTGADLKEWRDLASAQTGSPKPKVAKAAGNIVKAIDGYVEKLPRNKNVVAGDPVAAAKALPEANALNRRYMNSQKIDDVNYKVRLAPRRAKGPTKVGAYRDLLLNKKQMRGMDPRAKTEAETLVEGTMGREALQGMADTMSPGAGILGLAAGPTAGMIAGQVASAGVGVPVAGSVWSAGLLARKAAKRSVDKAGQRVEDIVRSGGMTREEMAMLARSGQGDPKLAQQMARIERRARRAPYAMGAGAVAGATFLGGQ